MRIIHVALLVAASGFSILAAGIPLDWGFWAKGYAIVSALAVGTLGALDLGVKANGLRNAWRHMNAALARYRAVPNYTVEQLIMAYESAEALIGDLPAGPRPSVTQPQSQPRTER